MKEDIQNLQTELAKRSTEELILILRNRDEEEWRPEVFDVVAWLLKGRGISPEEIAATGPEGVDTVESEPTVTIANFFSPPEAHLSRMALEEAGIAAWVTDELGGTMYGIGVGARLQVRGKDEAAAREVLAAGPGSIVDLPPELAEAPCPACGSKNVAPESWLDESDSSEAPRWHINRRKWYYVCADCREAWPA